MLRKRNTAELYYRYNLIVVAIFFAVFALSYLLVWLCLHDRAALICMIFFAAVMLPFEVFFLVRYLHYRSLEFRNPQKVALGRTHTNMIGMIAFEIELEEGRPATRLTTAHVFMSASRWHIAPNKLDDYLGREVFVGIDPAMNELIVLEREKEDV